MNFHNRDGPAAAVTANGPGEDNVGEQPSPRSPDIESQRTAVARSETQCEHCSAPFAPRKAGKPQRFCSEACRRAFHTGRRRPAEGQTPQTRKRAALETTDEDPDDADDEFDWNNDPSVCIGFQTSIAIYRNAAGGVTIRQEAGRYDPEDSFIHIEPSNLKRFALALDREIARIEACGELRDGDT